MKKQKKLLLKKINIASINHLQSIKGGSDETLTPDEGCLYEHTDVNATCVASEYRTNCSPVAETLTTCPPTATTRGNGSI